MQRHQIGQIAGNILALLAAAAIIGWASGDTPIVILDGSLTMQSAVPWRQFSGKGDQRAHPNRTGAISKVVVTVKGADHTITFNNQECTVDVTYASMHIMVTSGPHGKGLQVSPFSAFTNGSTPNILVHKNRNAKIAHVVVMRAGVKEFDSDASGGTKVVISFQ
jgi:hypothetical protein